MIMVIGSRTGMWSYRTSLLKITGTLYGAVEPNETVYGDCYVCSDFMIRILPNPGDIDGYSLAMVFTLFTSQEYNVRKFIYNRNEAEVLSLSFEKKIRMKNLKTKVKYILKETP